MFRTLTTRPLYALAAFLLLALAAAFTAAHADEEYLDPADAFRFSARMADPHTIAVTWKVADKYYMYREQFRFSAQGATLGTPVIPPGKVKYDQTFEKNVETHRGTVTVRIPVTASGPFTLTANSQGCADAGLCYPPQQHTAKLDPAVITPEEPEPKGITSLLKGLIGGEDRPEPAVSTPAPTSAAPPPASAPAVVAAATQGQPAAPAQAESVPPASTSNAAVPPAAPVAAAPSAAEQSDLSRIGGVLSGGSLLAIVPAFMLLGLGLAFTPCVLPMVPILSSIILGEGAHASRMRGLVLSIAYSLGMAIVYTALGIAAGLAGEGLAAALQNPWVLGAFALLVVGMALSMFGYYELQLPAALQTRLSGVSSRQQGGKLSGVFVMGALSALIVGPCVAAPLAGALVYISQTRDVVIGGAALFAMAVGMSVPLLLVGLSAGSLLPRAGAWMDSVKRFFGVLMLGMALWLVSPVLPVALQMAAWAVLLLGYGAYLLRRSGHWAALTAGAVFTVLGAIQLVGLASGGSDPLQPLAHLRGGAVASHGVTFKRIKTTADLDAQLAQLNGRPAILDFYADWCVSCKEMEKLTFTDARVQARMNQALLLQVDVTANDDADKAMMRRFELFGPPALIMFDGAGKEIPDSRVIGYQSANKFLGSLEKLR
ncbi:protein-disulfide reductase DsbD [Pseudoduganella sp. GCM10020061]|uniref:protein-disulfide reductase DsbD n=1 Tax=Pseudoduganella sp. GCM10020061 TaxID=3317345 RepID=UPI003628CF33